MAAVGLVRSLRAGLEHVCGAALMRRGSARTLSVVLIHICGDMGSFGHYKSAVEQKFCRWHHLGVPNTREPFTTTHKPKCRGGTAGDQVHEECATCMQHCRGPKEDERELANQALSRLQSVVDPASHGQVEASIGASSSSKTAETVPVQGPAAQYPAGDDEHRYAIQELERKILMLERQLREAMCRHDTAVAEAENLRRQTQQMMVDAKQFGITSFCRDLVAVADRLSKMTADFAQEKSATLNPKEVSASLTDVEVLLQSIFQKNGLMKICPIGGQYTPYEHEIECHVPTTEIKPGTVVAVTRTGYRLHGRTLRYALVHVSMEGRKKPV